jgi:peptidoglycan/LPS O-acetylase OafA/YrhL
MKYLQILNAVLGALGASMGIVLAVVCIFYWVYLDLDPTLRGQVPPLMFATAAFALLAMAGVGAFVAHRRGWTARWLLQLGPVLSLGLLVVFFARLRS